MGECLFARRGAVHTAPIILNPVFADNTWAEIVQACRRGKVPDTWAVGSSLTMDVGGTAYQFDIIGKNHDDYADGSGKAPLTFQMRHLTSTTYPMNSDKTNVGGWAGCEMRTQTLPAILATLPEAVRNNIREVNKLTSIGNAESTIAASADKLFLLSEVEVFGAANYSHSGEGSQYAWYAAGNSKTKNKNGYASDYFLRSPEKNGSDGFAIVNWQGTAADGVANNHYGVYFAFCF